MAKLSDDALRALRVAVLHPDGIGIVPPHVIAALADEVLELRGAHVEATDCPPLIVSALTGAPAWRDRLADLRSQIAELRSGDPPVASSGQPVWDQADAIAAALRAASNLRGARQAFERVESMMSSVTYSHGGRRWILTVSAISAIPEEL